MLSTHYTAQGFKQATITTESGYSWVSPIRGTDRSICEYFLGKRFNTAPYPSDRTEIAVQVVIDGKPYTSVPDHETT